MPVYMQRTGFLLGFLLFGSLGCEPEVDDLQTMVPTAGAISVSGAAGATTETDVQADGAGDSAANITGGDTVSSSDGSQAEESVAGGTDVLVDPAKTEAESCEDIVCEAAEFGLNGGEQAHIWSMPSCAS